MTGESGRIVLSLLAALVIHGIVLVGADYLTPSVSRNFEEVDRTLITVVFEDDADESSAETFPQDGAGIEAAGSEATTPEAAVPEPPEKEPPESEPAAPEPMVQAPFVPEPAASEPATLEPAAPEHAVQEPATLEPTAPLPASAAAGPPEESSVERDPAGFSEPRREPTESLPVIEPVRYVSPEYPEAARLRGLEGLVEVELRIGRRGRVDERNITVSSGSDILDRAVLRATGQWRFPREEEGRVTRHRFVFRLE